MKQIIVMRNDLNMRKGKMVAQGAHASMGAILPYLVIPPADDPDRFAREKQCISEWLGASFTKICVRVDSEQELVDVYEAAQSAGLIAGMITDNGLTEFHGVRTKTCCAIGPDTAENLAPITGELKLL